MESATNVLGYEGASELCRRVVIVDGVTRVMSVGVSEMLRFVGREGI